MALLRRPDFLRFLDRWLGVPLCWGLTRLRRARRVLSPAAPEPAAPRRVVFVLLSETGSMILADPAIRALTEASGQPAHFLTFAHNRPALAISGTVADANVYALRTDSPLTLLVDALRWRAWLRARRIDAVVDLELFSRLTAVLCLCSGIRQRAGFHGLTGGRAPYRGDLYTRPVAFEPGRHVSLNFLALVDALLGRPRDRLDTLPTPARHRPRVPETVVARALLATTLPVTTLPPWSGQSMRLVLVNPNASDLLPQRRWPVGHFVALICRLLERHADLAVALIGGPADRTTTASIAASVADPRCADLAGRLALPGLPALYAEADALVSNDSGPAHFAAVVDLPAVVLFGPETPRLYRPLGQATVLHVDLPCSPCVNVANQRRTRCRDNRCMQAISVDAVLTAVESILAARRLPDNVVALPGRQPGASVDAQRHKA